MVNSLSRGRLIIYHPINITGEKLAQGIKGLDYDILSVASEEDLLKSAIKMNPHIVLWGAQLDDQAKNTIRKLKDAQRDSEISVIAISSDPKLKLNDRIEAFNCGVNDFISIQDNLVELKSKILFQLGGQELRNRNFREKRYLEKLADTSYNLMLSQGVENLYEIAIDHLNATLPAFSTIFAIFNNMQSEFDFFQVLINGKEEKTLGERLQSNTLWRRFLLSQQVTGEVKDQPLFEDLQKAGIKPANIFHFPMVYKGLSIGSITLLCDTGTRLNEREIENISVFAQILAHRLREVHRFYGLGKHTIKKTPEYETLFKRPGEDQIIQELCFHLIKVLQADLCLFLNYNEGFRFLSPKYLYKGESQKNEFDNEKPPVLMIKELPILEKILNQRKFEIIDMLQSASAKELKNLPGFNGMAVSNVVIYLITVAQKVNGFLVLGRESIVKKYTRNEIEASENLLNSAVNALEENEILKQAKLTVKQLERIFDLGKELTLDATLEIILKKVCTAIRRTLGWNIVIMDIKNTYDDKFKTVSVLGLKDTEYQSLIKQEDYPSFTQRLPVSFPISNSFFYDHARKFGTAEGDFSGEWNDNDWVYVPISSRGNLLGMISLNDPVERRKPTEDRIRSIEYFANQAAVVIENTELFEGLKSSELRYRLLAETMTMGLVTCNTSGKIIYINNSLVKLLKYEKKDELQEQSLYNFCTENSRHRLEKEVVRTMAEKDASIVSEVDHQGIEIEMLAKDQEKIAFQIYTSPFYQHNKRIGFFGVLADLRSQKKIERMRADFNSMIVHDLRSPLNIIQGYVDIVRTKVVGEVNEEQVELLSIAKENVFKLLRLIDNFLTTSKLEAGHLTIEPETASLNELLESEFEHYKILVKEKNIKLEKNLDPNIPLLAFDKFRIEQVIRNYMSNAIKFTPKEGTITISTKLVKHKNDDKSDFDLFVKAAVKDTGVGIASEELGKVFNKYEQTEAGKDATLKGTGLGLAICREIIDLHKGEVWVESKPGQGSTFGFTLPIQNIDI